MAETKYIESVRLYRGKLQLLPHHSVRMTKAVGKTMAANVIGILKNFSAGLQPESLAEGGGVFKIRIVYDADEVELPVITPYRIRDIRSLAIVEAPDDLDYSHKYADRSALNALRLIGSRADEVLILRQGLITDSSFSNLLFRRKGKFFTPRSPLLEGVMRSRLLEGRCIELADISPEDLTDFDELHLINAMLPPGRVILHPACIIRQETGFGGNRNPDFPETSTTIKM